MLRKFGIIAVLSLLVTALAAVPALAVTNFENAPSGAHYARGAVEPVCTVTGTTVSCTGTSIQGVGNTNATTLLEVTSTISGTCSNPAGANNPNNPIEPFSESVTTSTEQTATPSRNGRIDIAPITATGTSTEEFLQTFECPNPQWTANVTSNVLTYTYTVTFAGFDAPVISLSGP